MNDVFIRCPRCNGRKNIFYLNGGYTLIDMGAPAVICPFCNGVGKIKKISEAIKDLIADNELNVDDSNKKIDGLISDTEKPKKRKYNKKTSTKNN